MAAVPAVVNGSEDETSRAELILIGIAVSNDMSAELALATQTAKERLGLLHG